MTDRTSGETGDMPDDEDPPRRPTKRPLWPWALLALACAGVFALYLQMEQRGPSVGGAGHVLVLPDRPETWVFLADGALLLATPQSARARGLATGPCTSIAGYLKDDAMEVQEAACTPGPLLHGFTERLKLMALKPGYWGPDLEPAGDAPEPCLHTLELMASMTDPRFDEPQMVPLWRELMPGMLAKAAAAGPLPPPLVVHVKRNDFLSRRLMRSELERFLARGRFSLMGAASKKGGWLVRDLVVDAGAPDPVTRLLVSPAEAPWDRLLSAPAVRARPPAEE